MTITEANAVNRIAAAALHMVEDGAKLSPDLECDIATLLINAHRTLKAGHSSLSFVAALAERKECARQRRNASCR